MQDNEQEQVTAVVTIHKNGQLFFTTSVIDLLAMAHAYGNEKCIFVGEKDESISLDIAGREFTRSYLIKTPVSEDIIDGTYEVKKENPLLKGGE